MSPLDPSERSLRARLAAHTMHAKNDSRTTSAPGRAAFLSSFEQKVDPDGVLPEIERKRRAEQLRRAHFARLALLSAQARRARKAAS